MCNKSKLVMGAFELQKSYCWPHKAAWSYQCLLGLVWPFEAGCDLSDERIVSILGYDTEPSQGQCMRFWLLRKYKGDWTVIEGV